MYANSVGGYRHALAHQLREQISELEAGIFDRIRALEDQAPSREDPALYGVRKIIRATLEYGLLTIELGEVHDTTPPAAVVSHARKVVWRSISLQTLLSRYFSCYSLFNDFVLRESESVQLRSRSWLREVTRSTDTVFERLIQIVGAEYQQELDQKSRSSKTRQLDRVKELLAGKLVSAPDLGYTFDATHIALVGSGPDVSAIVSELGESLGVQRLIVHPSPYEVWAWMGPRGTLSATQLADLLPSSFPQGNRLAIGEPAPQVHGWRQTHRQAKAAVTVASLGNRSVVRYAEAPLLASVTKDDLLQASLREMYLAPLATGRGGGELLRSTLRTYFAVDRNGNSAAAALGISRQAVAQRLQAAEEKLGQPLARCADALHMALQLEELGYISP